MSKLALIIHAPCCVLKSGLSGKFSIMMKTMSISNTRRYFEISATVITALGKFIFMDWLDWRFAYIATACLFWSIYVYKRYREQPDILTYWGFSTHNFKQVFRLVLPFGLLSLLVFFAIGYMQDTLILSWHIIPVLILYPLWGTIQQFLVVAIVAGNLKDMQATNIPYWLIVLFTSVLFGGVHYPHAWLILGTFLLAAFYAVIYLKEKNLYVLGIFHGWLGAFFFYTVLARDSFMEVFGTLL